MEATITVFINEDIAAARAILGDQHPTVRKLLAIDGDGDFYSAPGSAGARHALALVPAGASSGSRPGSGSGSWENKIIPFSNSTNDDLVEASLGRSVQRGGPCTYTRTATIQYLDRHRIDCYNGWSMSGFRFERGACQYHGNWFQRYTNYRSVSTCTKMSPEGVPVPINASAPDGGCSAYATGWKDINRWGGAVVNIAMFAGEVQCPRDHVMSGWKFRLANWQYARIEFKCCKTTLPLGEITPVYGRCRHGGQPHQRLDYLQLHSPTCPTGDVMTGWSIESTCGAWYLMRSRANCAKIPVPPPPSPSPPPPPPPHPPSPPPPAYLVNGVAIKAFHLSTRIVKPMTLKSLNGLKVNTLNLEMDCFKGADKFYYKGSLEADAGVSGDAASLNANAVFNFDTTSGKLELDATIKVELKAGPFTISGKMFKSFTGCVEKGTVISGKLAIDAGDFQMPGVTVVLTQYCMPEQMAIIDLTGHMEEAQLIPGVVIKEMSMSLVGVRKHAGASAEIADLDWTGSIGGTFAFDGSISIPGAVGDPTLTVTANMKKLANSDELDFDIKAKGTVQIAIGDAFTGTVTLDLMFPCNTGDKMTVSGTVWMKLGDWLDQQFSAKGVFMCGDIEEAGPHTRVYRLVYRLKGRRGLVKLTM